MKENNKITMKDYNKISFKFVWVVNTYYQFDGRCDHPPEAVFTSKEAALAYCEERGYHGMGQNAPNITKLRVQE